MTGRLPIAILLLVLTVPASARADEDGVSIKDGDCDDEDSTVYPGADELCDGKDNDCDEVLLDGEHDLDGDGLLACEGFECDDTRSWVHAGATEL